MCASIRRPRQVKLFPLPREFPNANLNTGTFDRKGIYWFTGQNGVYGRVDPSTGKTDAWKAPKGRGPYGITTTPSGDVWYASLAGDHIAKIDTVSGEATVVEPPRPGVGPRRVWSDSKGILWVSLWHAGESRTLRSGQQELEDVAASTLSRSGCYAVYVDDKDKVWLTDFIANAIVRFDPATEKFETLSRATSRRHVRQLLGPPGRSLGRGKRHRPAGRREGLNDRACGRCGVALELSGRASAGCLQGRSVRRLRLQAAIQRRHGARDDVAVAARL